jgi:hypothetical protein
VIYSVVVCNQGSVAAAATEVHVYYNAAAPPGAGQKGDNFQSVPALAPGACATRYVYRYGVPQGTYSSWAQVDPLNAVAEANEANNVAGPVKVTVGSTAGADLTIKSFTSQVMGASTVRYAVQVCNVGTGTAGASQVHVYYNRGAAPAAGENGDQLAYSPTLAPGACTTQYIYRYGTPSGSYTSWAQVDANGWVAETNEGNNVAGPITVVVSGPPQQADLAFQQFSAVAAGSNINYTIVVCNNGTVAAAGFRVDLFYNRLTPPPAGASGDSFDLVPQLAAGACLTLSRSAVNLQPGAYTSWATVDGKNAVSESNESNNTAGPRLVTIGTQPSCTAICAFATLCGLFTPAQAPECQTWCNGLSSSARQCAAQAAQSGSCSALKACNLPPPPPPPPPPGVCPDLCSYLITPCNLLPSGQYWTCIGACQNLAPDKIKCAQDAKAKGQCLQIVTCLF